MVKSRYLKEKLEIKLKILTQQTFFIVEAEVLLEINVTIAP